jgi:regulator of sirC expression with transglutaminase-like and TPR domain
LTTRFFLLLAMGADSCLGPVSLGFAAPPAAASTESLAALARPSVVVLSHFGRDGKEDGVGAGFVVSSNGLIATALHVIGEARPVKVRLADGREQEATEIHAWDRTLDLAIIRIQAQRLPALPLGDSDALKQGVPVVAMGNPLGLEHSIVQGVVSAKRELGGVDMLQLAIPVEPGNSGGPLLDLQGRVQGILTSKSALTPNLGFAIPVNALKLLLAKPNPVAMSHWLKFGVLNPRDWTTVFGGQWRQRAGRIEVEGEGTGFSGRTLCLWQGPVPPPPYEISASVHLDDESGAAGLVFCADGHDKHYGFYPSAGYLRLTRFDGPTLQSWSILEQVRSPHHRLGEWNHLRVRRETDRIRCYVNGQLVLEAADDKLPEGRVGLAKFRDTKAAFKNFQIGTNLAPAGRVPPASLRADLDQRLRNLGDQSDADLAAALRPHGEVGLAWLTERATRLETEAARLRRIALTLHEQAVQTELTNVLQKPEAEIDLIQAALVVSRLDNPDLDVASYRRQVDDLARDLAGRLAAAAAPAERLAALTNFLFAEQGFHGSRLDYDNRANSYLDQVLDDREGLPITLSILVIELGRRIGLTNLAGLSLPGHFMVRVNGGSNAPVFLDAFDGGRILSRAEVSQRVLSYTGAPLREDQLQPASKREILIRMLRNLLNLANRNSANTEALRYLDVIVALAPESALDRLARASLRLQTGDTAGAKADFQWLLDHKPPGLDLKRIEQLRQSLF